LSVSQDSGTVPSSEIGRLRAGSDWLEHPAVNDQLLPDTGEQLSQVTTRKPRNSGDKDDRHGVKAVLANGRCNVAAIKVDNPLAVSAGSADNPFAVSAEKADDPLAVSARKADNLIAAAAGKVENPFAVSAGKADHLDSQFAVAAGKKENLSVTAADKAYSPLAAIIGKSSGDGSSPGHFKKQVSIWERNVSYRYSLKVKKLQKFRYLGTVPVCVKGLRYAAGNFAVPVPVHSDSTGTLTVH